MKKPPPYSALLVGLGGIGFRYDSTLPESRIYTHSRAIQAHPDFRLIGAIDPDARARDAFTKLTGIPVYANWNEFPEQNVDFISLAVPTALHAEAVTNALELRPSLILLEKPIAPTLEEAEKVRGQLKATSVNCAVNYIRRFDPVISSLHTKIQSGSLGTFQGGSCFYSDGLFNCASHYIDLLGSLLGKPDRFLVVDRKPALRPAGDIEADFLLFHGSAKMAFFSMEGKSYSVGEIELYFEHGRLRIADFGERVEVFAKGDDPEFAGCFRLLGPTERRETGMKQNLLHVIENMGRFLGGTDTLKSDIDTAMGAMLICERIKDSRASLITEL